MGLAVFEQFELHSKEGMGKRKEIVTVGILQQSVNICGHMWKMFVWLLLCSGSLLANSSDWRQEIHSIDEEMRTLEDRKTKVLGRANRLEDNAIRWQFMPDQYNETKRAYAQADAYREEARVIQRQIELLDRKKQRILEQHGIIP
ncbi:MAG: hypothetical protein KGZ39_04185 [Simkania sp.]|nr:hypothetical protein [Simkania sp.]